MAIFIAQIKTTYFYSLEQLPIPNTQTFFSTYNEPFLSVARKYWWFCYWRGCHARFRSNLGRRRAAGRLERSRSGS